MDLGSDTLRRQELGRYLRKRRDGLRPEQAGVTRAGRRRHVPGLRRYEVADLAFVSETWYTWLEQARLNSIRPDALDAVARALQLDEHAWRYVRFLAGAPVIDADRHEPGVIPELVELVEGFHPHPASLTTTALDVVAFNRMQREMHCDPADFPPRYRNALWMAFMTGRNVPLHDPQASALLVLARFRFERARFPANPRFDELIEELSAASPLFDELWERGDVQPTTGPTLTLDHPVAGPLNFVKFNLIPADRDDLLLTVHHPADRRTRQSLEELAAALP